MSIALGVKMAILIMSQITDMRIRLIKLFQIQRLIECIRSSANVISIRIIALNMWKFNRYHRHCNEFAHFAESIILLMYELVE